MARWLLAAASWMSTALRRAVRIARRFLMAALVAILLITNVLAFTSAAFVNAVSAAVAATGFATVQARAAAGMSQAAATRRTAAKRIATRTVRGAFRSVAGTVPQSLPLIGIASVVGLTTWELIDACDTLRDIAELEPDLGGPDRDIAHEMQAVCGIEAPTAAEVKAAVRGRAGEWMAELWRWTWGGW